MSCNRKSEYFGKYTTNKHDSVGRIPKQLYRQETDWTCAIACLRTMISGIDKEVFPENHYVEKFSLKPGPYYSKNIKAYNMLDEYDVIYGCDMPDVNFDDIISMMENGYYIMLESMVNYSHWMVLLGYLTVKTSDELEGYMLMFYEPYYNEVRMINADEFRGVWRDGPYETTKVEKDFIAIKAK